MAESRQQRFHGAVGTFVDYIRPTAHCLFLVIAIIYNRKLLNPTNTHLTSCLTRSSAGMVSLKVLLKLSQLMIYSKEDFEKAIGEQGKYVLILAYKDSVHPKAEE